MTKHDGARAAFRWMLALAALATACVGLWLVIVTATVLPTRDPAHIPMWRGIACAFFLYSGLTWAYLARGQRDGRLRAAAPAASIAAMGAGAWGIADMLRVADEGGHFEGYVVLMGLILFTHGALLLAYHVRTRRLAREVSPG